MPPSPWHFTDTGFNTTEDTNIGSLCVFGSKIYAGTYNASNLYYPKIYESTDGVTWTLNYTFNDKSLVSDDSIVSMVVYSGKLYALRSYAGQSNLYEYDGSSWSFTKDLYTTYGAKYPTHLNVYGGMLFAGGSATAAHNHYDLNYTTTPTGAWYNAIHDNKQAYIEKTIEYNGDLFALGAYANIGDGAYIYKCHSGLWDAGTQFVNSLYIYDAVVYKDKLYAIGDDRLNSSTYIYLYIYDGASWTITHLAVGYINAHPSVFVSADNYLELQAPNTFVGGHTIYNLYHSPDGIDFSNTEAYGSNEFSNPFIITRAHANFQRRTFLGGGLNNTGLHVGVYYTNELVSADFTGAPTSGLTPLPVNFTDTSIGNPTSWDWDFGDLSPHGSVANPSHTYSGPGTYTVTLTISNDIVTDTKTRVNYITVTSIPVVADFVGIPLSGDAPLTVQFIDQSSFVATSWFWDFGDGNIGTTGPTVSHTYDFPGMYTVTLIASNIIEGSRTVTKVDYITASFPIPVASFTLSPVTGFEPLTVTFTDTSTGFPQSWFWDFGDGNTSTAQNPIHIYSTPGTYTITLTVMNPSGSSTSLPATVAVVPAPNLVADFITGNITPHPSGLEVEFFEQSIDALTYTWDFGDPASGILNISTDPNPVHVYPGPGVYAVLLTVTRGPFTDSICKSVLVTTEPTRYMEIWGTAHFSDGTQVVVDKVVSVNQVVSIMGVDCTHGAVETTHIYHTVDDAGVTRFLVRARGNVLSIPESGFADGDPVYIYVGGRLATTYGSGIIPVSIPFYMTLPSSPTSTIEVDLVFPAASTSISPMPGVYQDFVTVTLMSNVTPAGIYYTIDGTDPRTSPTRQLYVDSFIVEEGITTVRYYTDDPLGSVEPVNEAVYTVLSPLVIPTPPPSTYSDNLFVTLAGNRQGDVYYRLDYLGGYNKFTSPIPIEAGPSGVRTTVIQAYLIDYHSEVGPILEFMYKIDLASPVISLFTLSNGDPVTASSIITAQVIAASHANSVTGLLLSTFSDFRDAFVRLYQPEVTFLLPGPDGTKTVYAKVVDQLGHYSDTKSATINLSTEIPAFTVSPNPPAPISELVFTFVGTKSTNSGIFLTINSNPESLVIPFGPGTTWEYNVPLVAGINTLLFQAGTWVGHRSPIETRIVDARPIPVGITEATTIARPDGTWRIPFVFLDEKTGEEGTEGLSSPKKQHENVKKRQHDFRIRVSASYGPDPLITFPTEGIVLTENLITVTGRAAPGSVITLRVERRGKVPA
jgi:PKD repeat protein